MTILLSMHCISVHSGDILSDVLCSVGSVGDPGRHRPPAPGGGALLCGGGDGGGHPELGQVRSQPLSSGKDVPIVLSLQYFCVKLARRFYRFLKVQYYTHF